MSPQDAFHHVCHEYPGSIEALAPRIGRGAAVLRNKATLDHGTPTVRRSHEPTLADVSSITRVSGDLRVIDALAAEVNAVVLRLPEVPMCGDDALLDLVLGCNREFGEVCAEIRNALADGEISRETLESVLAQLELLDRLRGLMVERRPVVRMPARAVKGVRK